MAELVDALDSKSCIRKDVQVRFLFWALKKMKELRLFVTPFCFLLIRHSIYSIASVGKSCFICFVGCAGAKILNSG